MARSRVNANAVVANQPHGLHADAMHICDI